MQNACTKELILLHVCNKQQITIKAHGQLQTDNVCCVCRCDACRLGEHVCAAWLKQISRGEQSGHVAWYVWTNVACKIGTVVHVMYNSRVYTAHFDPDSNPDSNPREHSSV